jgi:tetratricopeptide (TPR) repeat protein
MPTVFLSYSREDLPLIEQLEGQLKKHSEISIWRDQEKIYGGQKWPKILGEAIADQDVFLLAWSKHTAASHFVEFEWCTAIALKKTLVVCLLDKTELHSSLTATQAIPVSDSPKIVAAITGADISVDAGRRAQVVGKLEQIEAEKPKKVLRKTRILFDQKGWIVQGDMIQAKTVNIHHHVPLSVSVRYPVLRGRVFFIGDDDQPTAASDVSVTLLQTAEKTITDSDGLFTLPFPDTFQPGTTVEVGIKKDDWVIYSPIDGEITIPVLDSELVKIRLIKKGSPKLWSAERIEKFIENMGRKAKEQIRPEGKPEDVDLGRYIRDWALQCGFSPQQAKVEIDKWVAEAEQKNDPHQLGLASYAKKNFGQASKLLEASALEKVRLAREAGITAQQFTKEAIRDFWLAGDAHMNNYEFAQALATYRQALGFISRNAQPRLWGKLTVAVGVASYEIAIRSEGDLIHEYLKTAATAYRLALAVYTKETLPQDWVELQIGLGNVLREQGIRTGGEAGTRQLAQAVDAYRTALTVHTKETLPHLWGASQNNLGNVLQEQGTRTEGETGTNLLAQAADAYRAALTVYTKEQLPQQWAATQNNFGLVLREQGTRTSGEACTNLLAQAASAYHAALTVHTKESLPQQWAGTQTNLGNVLQDQGMRTEGATSIRLLAEAVAAYKAALTVRTKEVLPQDWAATQNGLGAALWNQGTRTEGEAGTNLLAQAADAYRAALTVYTKEQLATVGHDPEQPRWRAGHPRQQHRGGGWCQSTRSSCSCLPRGHDGLHKRHAAATMGRNPDRPRYRTLEPKQTHRGGNQIPFACRGHRCPS